MHSRRNFLASIIRFLLMLVLGPRAMRLFPQYFRPALPPQKVFEIGAVRRYFIPGRTLQSCTVGRIHYDGVALMRALHAPPEGFPVMVYPIGVIETKPTRGLLLDDSTQCPPGV